jgi:hypothetical protein
MSCSLQTFKNKWANSSSVNYSEQLRAEGWGGRTVNYSEQLRAEGWGGRTVNYSEQLRAEGWGGRTVNYSEQLRAEGWGDRTVNYSEQLRAEGWGGRTVNYSEQLRAEGWGGRSLGTGSGENVHFSLLHIVLIASGFHPRFSQWLKRTFSQGIKRPVRNADYSLPNIAPIRLNGVVLT